MAKGEVVGIVITLISDIDRSALRYRCVKVSTADRQVETAAAGDENVLGVQKNIVNWHPLRSLSRCPRIRR